MSCIFEINDADLTLYRDAEVVHRSPAVAVVLGDEVYFGEAALQRSRMHPRQTHQQYFSRLSGEPLPGPAGRIRHQADLVYLHLRELKPLIDAEGGEALLAVPGNLSADQLGVLLGVMQEAGIAVAGFVDSAVAAASAGPGAGGVRYLDVQLQRALITELEVGDEVSKTGVSELPDCGLGRLLDGWVNVVADRFVRDTRFDPLHAAATEQQVFDQVYRWMQRGGQGDLLVDVLHGDQTRRVEVGRAALEEKSAQRLAPLLDARGDASPVYLSARSARLPGLRDLFARAGITTVTVADDAVARGCLAHRGLITGHGGDLRLVTRLPHRTTAAPAAAAPAAEARPAGAAPTHALRDAEARPLDALAAALGLEQDDDGFRIAPRGGVMLNGTAVNGSTRLRAGDRISLDGADYLLIHVGT
ncbi:MAG: hypothetical protein RIB46_04075 [Pseudomonadales bacterium]